MIDDPYSETVRALFDAPLHAGGLESGVSAGIDDQGVRVELFAKIEGDAIRTLRFRAWGCPHLIAAAEAFCAAYESRLVDDLEGFAAHELMQSLPVPVEKTGRILVLEDVVRSLGSKARDTSSSSTDGNG